MGLAPLARYRWGVVPVTSAVTLNAAKGRRNRAGNGMVAKAFGDGAPQLLRVWRMRKHERALNVCPAVTSARKLEVSLADGAHAFEHPKNVFSFHCFVRREGWSSPLGGLTRCVG